LRGSSYGTGLVAVGTGVIEEPRSPGFGLSVAKVWTSVDGISWTNVAHDNKIFNVPDGAAMNDVTVGGPGLVTVGLTGLDNSLTPTVATVWTSVDGLTWVRDSDEGSAFGAGSLSDVAVAGPGLVAVGTVEGDRDLQQYSTAAIWTAPTGQ